MLKVLFRADDGPGIGAGHLMRCLALAEAVRERGGAVHLSAARASALHVEWEKLGAVVQVEPRAIGSGADLATTQATARAAQADWLVVDGYGFDTAWLDAAAAAQHTLCLDDLGQRDPAVSLVLNQNPGAEQRYGSAYRRCGRALLGLDWFLLRRAWREARHEPEPGRLLLTLGGDDPDNRMLGLMQALLADGRDFVADVVSSAPEAGFRQAQALAEAYPDRFALHCGPVELPPLMRRAAVVVSGGGVTPVEAASLGAAPVVLVLADNQKPGAEYLAAAGAARVTTLAEDGIAKATSLALDVLHDDAARAAMAARGRGLIDGGGAARLVAVMMEMKERG
ncbi:MAG: hypothetical protein HXY26_09205 [Hydrogenophilaceae bacterium]|nr:hypothetical protein [Hydrogenophilaceae bacterium]